MIARVATSTFGVMILMASGCSLPPTRNPNMPNRDTQCPPHLSKVVYMDGDLSRPLDGGGNGVVIINAAITIAAVTLPDPGYEGVMFSDMVITKAVRVLDRQLPFSGRACMPPDKPVAWLFRVTLTSKPDQAYDNLQCRIESEDQTFNHALTIRRVELSDLMQGADEVQVQCLWTWVPDGYSGPIPEPPLGK